MIEPTYELRIRDELNLLAFLSSMFKLLLEPVRVSRPRWPLIDEATDLIRWLGWKTTKCSKHDQKSVHSSRNESLLTLNQRNRGAAARGMGRLVDVSSRYAKVMLNYLK